MVAEPLKNLPLNKSLLVEFNWESNIPSRTIRDTIVVSYEKENNEAKEEDINEIIDVERTVDFEQPERCTDKPILSLILPETENFFINRLRVVCDCKIIEVFGDHGMYIDTIHGTVVEECENFRAVEFKVDMCRKVNKKVSINFLKLNPPMNRLWLYGLHIQLKPMSSENLTTSIKFENVEELIEGIQISDNASKCMQFLKESMSTAQFNASKMSSPGSTKNVPTDAVNSEKLIQEIKLYIDHKFQVLTEFLILRERNLHDKVDMILDYIKNQNRRSS